MSRERLGTKAETLQRLYRKLKYAQVLPQYTFTVAEWMMDPEQVIKNYLALDWKAEVIVWSSSLAEDTSNGSQAGRYESVASVCGEEAFRNAIEKVIDSTELTCCISNR